MLMNTKEMFEIALKNNFAIGAFNFANMEVLQGIIDGAEVTQSPLILQVVPKAVNYATLPFIVKLVEAALVDCSLPIALHLDHGDTFDLCKQCVDIGFTSVMIDGSHLPFDENVELTKKVCGYAHDHNPYVSVEAELGQVAGVEGSGEDNEAKVASVTDPDQAKEFIEKTQCDSLAIACGTKHGAYKYSKDQSGCIRFDVLKKFSEQLSSLPVVIHGSSAVPSHLIEQINSHGGQMVNAVGIADDDIHKAVNYSVCKINIDTDLRLAMTGSLRQFFSENPSEFEPMSYLGCARNAVSSLVQSKNKTLNSTHTAKLFN